MQTMADHPRARFDLWSEAVGTRMRAWRAVKKGFRLAEGDPGRCNICTYDGPLLDKPPYLQCPRCKSSNRHRLIRWALLNDSPLLNAPGARVLHFAPELSLGAMFRAWPSLRYETADLCAKGVTHNFDLVKSALDQTFDLIVANHILEHIPDDQAAMRNIARMLKPGGAAIVTVPLGGETTFEDASITDPAERARCFGADDHVRMYGLDIVDRLRAAGLRARAWTLPDDHPDVRRWAMGGETLFLCAKQ
jgi:hypothetical protein